MDSSYHTQEFVQKWSQAESAVLRAEAELERAKTELVQATNALGGFLCPDDARVGELFCIWVRYAEKDRLIEVTMLECGWKARWRGAYRVKSYRRTDVDQEGD